MLSFMQHRLLRKLLSRWYSSVPKPKRALDRDQAHEPQTFLPPIRQAEMYKRQQPQRVQESWPPPSTRPEGSSGNSNMPRYGRLRTGRWWLELVHIHIHTHKHTHMHTHTHINTHMHTHTHTRKRTYTYMHVHTHTLKRILTHTPRTYLHAHAHIHAHTHTHIH